MRYAALLLLMPALAGCQILAFPYEILPSDKVQNEQQAILMAQRNCGPATPIKEWEARLVGGTWKAWWTHRQNSITVEIDKKSGQFTDCHIDIETDE